MIKKLSLYLILFNNNFVEFRKSTSFSSVDNINKLQKSKKSNSKELSVHDTIIEDGKLQFKNIW